MGFLSKDTLEDMERVRKQRENEIYAKRKAELAANSPGKYVVLRYLTGFKEWILVSESKGGLSMQDAQIVYQYEHNFGKVDARNLLIVKVED
jgi:hypothetical protein|nr:MAG TPA: hypothetical protein [Caudoviricetes sp.]